MPQLSQIHIDTALTNVSIMYRNEMFVADDVLPPLPVVKRSDKYFIYDKSMMLSTTPTDAVNNNPLSLRRPKAEAAELDFTLSTDNYYAEEYALRQLVTDAEINYADNPLQPDIDATMFLTERLKLDNEVKVAGLVLNGSKYAGTNKVTLTTGGSGTSWAQYASVNSNPFNDIKNGKIAVIKGVMREANTFLLTVDTARVLADHPLVKDLVKYVHADALTTSGLPKVMRGLRTVEASAQKNTAPEGAVFNGGNVWLDSGGNNSALILYVGDGVSPRSIHFGRTFEAPDDTTGARGYQVRRYRWEPKKGTYIEASTTRDYKLIALDGSGNSVGGYLVLSATA